MEYIIGEKLEMVGCLCRRMVYCHVGDRCDVLGKVNWCNNGRQEYPGRRRRENGGHKDRIEYVLGINYEF